MSARDNRNILRRGPSPKGLKLLLRRFEQYCAKNCKCERGEGLDAMWGSWNPYMDPKHRMDNHLTQWLASIHNTHIDILFTELQKAPEVNAEFLKYINEEVAKRCVDGMLLSNPETIDSHGRNYEDKG